MFADAFWPNFVLFLLGQVAAWGYLRTGLGGRGAWVLVLTWVLADVALVARFGYDHVGSVYVGSLAGMQFVAVAAFGAFLFARVRRRLKGVVGRVAALRRAGFVAYLRGDLEVAIDKFGRILRLDPWDTSARVALGTALLRQGRARPGRRILRSVRGLDRAGSYTHAVQSELRPGTG